MTREQWLNQFVQTVRPIFRAANYPLPPIRADAKQILGIVQAVQDRDTWEITITDDIHQGTLAAEALISSLVFRSAYSHPAFGFNAAANPVEYDHNARPGERLGCLLSAVVEEMPPYPEVLTRKKWLKLFTSEMQPWFEAAGIDLPNIEVIPGQIHPGKQHRVIIFLPDDHCLIFIDSKLTNALKIATMLAYEFVRCVVGSKGVFSSTAKRIGIPVGGISSNLTDHLEAIIARTGPYPEK